MKTLSSVKTMIICAGDFLITFGIGYTDHTDNLIKSNKFDMTCLFMKRIDKYNNWVQCSKKEAFKMKYNEPYKWANAIGIITNAV